MSLVQRLHSGKIDLIGDIHGEIEALLNLLAHLGYDEDGIHTEGRKLVFVGDLCDRGPDTPKVLKTVKRLVEKGGAQMVLGNHELNLLQGKPKDGAGWFFKEREIKDKNYEPFVRVEDTDREELLEFVSKLPIALENEELRVVHAAWLSEKVEHIRNIALGNAGEVYNTIEKQIDESIRDSGLLAAYHNEQDIWGDAQEDPTYDDIPFLAKTSEYNLAHQMNNPLRVLTSGVEQKCQLPFYAGGKWRFVERYTWWDRYEEDIPVVVGHFWRKMNEEVSAHKDENVFAGISPFEWHGKKNNVFCVDFSVGGRFKERLKGNVGENTCLVALRWPERTLVLENGEVMNTVNFKNENPELEQTTINKKKGMK